MDAMNNDFIMLAASELDRNLLIESTTAEIVR